LTPQKGAVVVGKKRVLLFQEAISGKRNVPDFPLYVYIFFNKAGRSKFNYEI
jgi:hypothetical protein